MCEPATIIMATAAVVGAMGTIQQGQQAAAMGKYQQRVAEMNARAAEQEAEYARQASEREASIVEESTALDVSRHREQVGRLQSKQRSLLAGSGVDTQSGSALNLLSDTAAQGAVDEMYRWRGGQIEAANARQQGSLSAWGSGIEASNLRVEGALARAKGQSSQKASYFKAGSTLLSGAADTYSAGKSAGLFKKTGNYSKSSNPTKQYVNTGRGTAR